MGIIQILSDKFSSLYMKTIIINLYGIEKNYMHSRIKELILLERTTFNLHHFKEKFILV